MLEAGTKAPINIPFQSIEGEFVTLSDYLHPKKYLVLYFYPKDNTPGCTDEACNFRDYNEEISKFAKILGISSDSPKKHQNFRNKYHLNFELASDKSHELQEAFGIWVEKKMFGHTFMGTKRSTFIINQDGIIVKVWPEVKPENHGKEVLDYLILSS